VGRQGTLATSARWYLECLAPRPGVNGVADHGLSDANSE
jgi:hypothetical protein